VTLYRVPAQAARNLAGWARNGRLRYTAYYWDVRGKERSASTYSSRKDTDGAWQAAEVKVREGRAVDDERDPGQARRVRTAGLG
jgi:hypothetical protein